MQVKGIEQRPAIHPVSHLRVAPVPTARARSPAAGGVLGQATRTASSASNTIDTQSLFPVNVLAMGQLTDGSVMTGASTDA